MKWAQVAQIKQFKIQFKAGGVILHQCLYFTFWQLYKVIHSFATSTVSKHALNLICTELGLIVPFGLDKKNAVWPKLQCRLPHEARITSKLTFYLLTRWALRVISINFLLVISMIFVKQSGHSNYGHNLSRWICLIFYQLLSTTSVGNE